MHLFPNAFGIGIEVSEMLLIVISTLLPVMFPVELLEVMGIRGLVPFLTNSNKVLCLVFLY